jgi:Zn-dependent protease
MRTVWEEWRADASARPAAARGEAAAPAPALARPSGPRRPAQRPSRHPSPATGNGRKAAIGLTALLALLAKFGKVAFGALAWGAKTLKLGSILPTAASMALSVWAYAQLWGWRFAAGLVGLLFVHELGHAGVMAAKGLRTSPIVFIPGLGALIALKDQFLDARVEAQTGWGGPAVGALGAAACYLAWSQTGHPLWLGLAFTGCLLNLFNLLPVSPLDGGRIVTAISPWLWLPGLAVAGWLGFTTGHPLLLLILLLGVLRAVREWRARRRGENLAYFDIPPADRALLAVAYFGLCAGLGWLTHHAHQLTLQAT